MGTIWIKEFTGGLDVRRLPETTPGGVLLQAINGHISRGGEFEKRAAFVKEYTLPHGTVGLGFVGASRLVVWGSGDQPAGIPNGVIYQKLVHPVTPTISLIAINSFAVYKNKLYVSARFSDGDVYHYYDGVQVADFDYGCAKIKFKVTGGVNIATKAAQARFRITGGTNSVSNKITLIRANGVPITQKAIQHTGNNVTTATAIAKEINRFTSNPNYGATSYQDVVTVFAYTTGTAINGKLIGVTTTGNVSIASVPPGGNIAFAGGVDAKQSTIDLSVGSGPTAPDIMAKTGWRSSNSLTAKAVVAAINSFHGTRDFHAVWDGADGVSVIANFPGTAVNGAKLNYAYTNGFTTDLTPTSVFGGGKDPPAGDGPVNLPYLPGDFVGTHDRKIYTLSGGTMYWSGIDKPTNFKDPETNTGAGFVDFSSEVSGAEELMAFAKYLQNLAVFAYSNIIIRYIDPNPDLNRTAQVLRNTGTRSPHSVCQFGDNDVFYLDESGIRSLRARDSSNSAATSDIGVLVDPLVLKRLQSMTYGERLKIFGLIEPTDGRFWLIMKDVIFVFSYFSGAKVSAWSTYIPSTPQNDPQGNPLPDRPFDIDEAVVYRRRVYVRSGDLIYSYGGDTNPIAALEYDTIEAIMQTPFLEANAPAKEKSYQGWDAAIRGTWRVDAVLDPNNQEVFDILGFIDQTTTPHNRLPLNAMATSISLRFRTRSAEKAIVGNGLVHYTMDGEDDGTR